MSVLELKMILSARSCTLSSLRLSEALQKCQTVWQYVKFGKYIYQAHSISIEVIGLKLRSRSNHSVEFYALL